MGGETIYFGAVMMSMGALQSPDQTTERDVRFGQKEEAKATAR